MNKLINDNFLLFLSDQTENYVSHGEIVVNHFKTENGGLIKLEQLWREHFLKIMRPQFMPPLWAVDHTARRLEIRASEGRVEREDLILAGIDPTILKSNNVSV